MKKAKCPTVLCNFTDLSVVYAPDPIQLGNESLLKVKFILLLQLPTINAENFNISCSPSRVLYDLFPFDPSYFVKAIVVNFWLGWKFKNKRI